MKRKFKWIFAAFLSSFSPIMCVAGDVLDSEGILSITVEDIEDWIQAYNNSLTWPKDYKSENPTAFLAKVIGSERNPKGIVLNEGTQYLKNRQLGIQLIGKTHRKRWRERRDAGSAASPYEIFLTSVDENGETIKYELLGQWSQNVHVIEWEGVGNNSESRQGSEGKSENYRGVMAVSFLPENELKNFINQFSEQDPINVQDIDIRDILKKTVKLDYDFGNIKVADESGDSNTFIFSGVGYKVSSSDNQLINLGGAGAQEKTLAQEILNNTDWMKRNWYKGEDLKNKTSDESWTSKEFEIKVPEKYYLKTSEGGQQIEFSEDEIKGIVKVEKETNEGIAIGNGGSESKITVENRDLSTAYWIRRRNMNIVRRVIKELLIQEGLEDVQLDKAAYSYSDLEDIVKKKFILDKFRGFDTACSGNTIDTDDWLTFDLELEDEDDEEEEEGGAEEAQEDLFEEEKFCGKWKYPKVKGFEDPELQLTETVWDDLKKEVETELEKLRGILKNEMKTYLNSGGKTGLTISSEKIEQIHQLCGKDLNSCQIKPKTTTVTEYKRNSEKLQPEQSTSIKENLISLPDKFGVVKSWNPENKFVNPEGSRNDKLAPIVWTIQTFSEGKDQKPWSKFWSSDYSKEPIEKNKKQIKITKVKEWR